MTFMWRECHSIPLNESARELTFYRGGERPVPGDQLGVVMDRCWLVALRELVVTDSEESTHQQLTFGTTDTRHTSAR
jgi:hypothetical protein